MCDLRVEQSPRLGRKLESSLVNTCLQLGRGGDWHVTATLGPPTPSDRVREVRLVTPSEVGSYISLIFR